MKGNLHMKARGPSRVNGQQVTFELKHKVIRALNKIADRDTYQIGVDELDKLVECLTPDMFSPFVSCILDTDSEQKSAVRKECIRLIGTLARFHQALVRLHLNKMVASVVKRLKDSDSVVRDACVETMSVLALKLINRGDETDGVFVTLVRPLFEALGEQNKQVQSGAALCLARVVDNTNDPPVSILQRMLTRTIKLLKNPHFMGKPAVIELNRSIILAGGAATKNVLLAAMASIQDGLKSSDWATRKAASVALGEIAASGGSFLGIFKASCIHSLESCHFDKVKPVRETVLHALQYWRGIPGQDTPEPSEAGSSVKENFCGGDFSDLTSPNDHGRKDATLKKVTDSDKRRTPLAIRKACQNYMDHLQQSKPDDWHIEIAVPKTHNVSLADVQNEESESSCVTKTLERMSVDVTSIQDIENEYVPMDDKHECSSVSSLATENFETKFVTVSHDRLKEGDLSKNTGRKQCFRPKEIGSEEQLYSAQIRDRRSLDSIATESSSQPVRGCCSQVANEMACIRKQLLEIESKQSSLMDLLQVFSTGITDSLSMLQSKVLGLEHVVDRIGQELVHAGKYSDLANSKLVKQSQSVVPSPRLSTCPSRPSVDIHNRPSSFSVKNSEIWEEKTFGRSRSSNMTKEGTEMWTNPVLRSARNPIGKDNLKNSEVEGTQAMGQIRKTNSAFALAANANVQLNLESKNNLWQCVKGYLCEGDLDSAYVEALCAGDEHVLIELLERTGPVLESLSHKTISDLLSTLASYFLDQRFMNSIIPWVQQVVDLTSLHGPNYLIPSAKARQEFLSAVQGTLRMEFSNPLERRSIKQLSMKLCQVWGNCC